MKQITITMHRDKECKGSVRFTSRNEQDPVTNVYISREVSEIATAQTVKVTVEIEGT